MIFLLLIVLFFSSCGSTPSATSPEFAPSGAEIRTLQPEPVVAHVWAANVANYPRRSVDSCIVPFAPGEVRDLSTLSVKGTESTFLSFGNCLRPDGSYRFARAVFRTALAAHETHGFDIVKAVPSTSSFVLSPWLQASLAQFNCSVWCDGNEAGLGSFTLLEYSNLRWVLLSRSRIPNTSLIAEWILTVNSNCDYVPFSVRVINSDPTVQTTRFNLNSLRLKFSGCVPVFHYQNTLPTRQITAVEHEILSQTYLDDGQGRAHVGTLVFYRSTVPTNNLEERVNTINAEREYPVMAVAPWKTSDSFGPFGVADQRPPWLTTDADAWRWVTVKAGEREQARPNLWGSGYYGLNPQSGSTGYQPDFGSVQCLPVAYTGNPALLYAYRESLIREVYRPNHFFEANGSILSLTAHPNLVIWDGRPHYNRNVSPDQLGKNDPTPQDFHQWGGFDRQHWSQVTLGSYHLLTGDYAVLGEILQQQASYLYTDWLPPKPGYAGIMDAPRAVGRTLLTMSWFDCSVPTPEVQDRVNGRVSKVVLAQWTGKDPARPIRPVGLIGQDDRVPVVAPSWSWQEPIAGAGLLAVYLHFGNDDAKAILDVITKNWCTYAYREPDWQCVAYISYLNGVEALYDSTHVSWADGTDFRIWALPLVVYGMLFGDSSTQTRARQIYNYEKARRIPPADGGWDQFAVWSCVWPGLP